MKYKLMIKTHQYTGLKYLCVTTKTEYHKYSGSGINWRKHLKEHGRFWDTELLFETDNKEEFSKVCLEKSIGYNIINSPKWANSVYETGGGEYPVDESGKRILTTNPPGGFKSREEMLEFCRNSKWFECSVCGARTTENSYTDYGPHRKCKKSPEFSMIPFHPEQFH
jgi:hypothetical protein